MPKKKKKANVLLNSRIAVWTGAIVLFFLGIILTAQGFIDTHNYRDQIIKVIRDQTGRDVTIKGKVTISLLPLPTIYIPGVELRDMESENPAPAATVDMVRIRVPVSQVFSDHPRISGIMLDRPLLELVRGSDNTIHWEWLNASLFKALANAKSESGSFAVEVNDGKLAYHDNTADKGLTVDNINFYVTSEHVLDGRGSFGIFGHDLKYTIGTAEATAPNVIPFKFRIYSDQKNEVKLEGKVDFTGDIPEFTGTLAMDTDDMLKWVRAQTVEDKQLLGAITNQATKEEEEKVVLPLKLSSDWKQEGLNASLTNVQLTGLNSAGTGSLGLSWRESLPVLNTDMDFSALNYNQWRLLLTSAFVSQADNNPIAAYTGVSDSTDNPLPKDIEFALQVKADQLYVNSQVWKNARLSGILSESAITVNQFNIELPGESNLSLFGIISQGGTTKGLRFEGSMETEGKSLRNMLTVFDESAADLPETGFGDFYARSNIFVSSEQMRLSEADVKLSDLRLNGGLVAYYDTNPRLEADVKLKDINFDYFRDVWRDKERKAGREDFFLRFDKGMNFDWLKRLQTNIDFKVSVDGFTFLDRQGDTAGFRIYVKQGEFGIYDIRFYYPTETTEASFTLNVRGEQPYVNVMLNTNALDTNYFHVDFDDKKGVDEKAKPMADTPFDQIKAINETSRSLSNEQSSPLDTHAPDASKPAAAEAPATKPAATPPALPADIKPSQPPVPPATPALPVDKAPALPPAPAAPAETPTSPALPTAPAAPPVTPAPAADANAVKLPEPPAVTSVPAMPAPALPEPPSVTTEPKMPEASGSSQPRTKSEPPPVDPLAPPAPAPIPLPGGKKLEIVPQADTIKVPSEDMQQPPPPADSIEDIRKKLEKSEEPAAAPSQTADADTGKKLWSEDLIDMGWMEGFNGSFDISIGKFTHGKLNIDRLKLQAKLERNLFTFQNCTFSYWQGRGSILGSMYGGKVPGISVSFTMFNTELRDMMKSLTGRENVTGKASLTGTITTSGVNYLSWVSQADAKIVMTGRGVIVQGLNLPGVVDAVAISRTAADVFNNVNSALVRGWTSLMIDGNVNVKNGIMRTPGIAIRADNIIGDMKGEVRLVPWTMDLTTLFQFPAMTSETVPTMTVQLTGPINKPQLRTDTASLEAYVAKRIISR